MLYNSKENIIKYVDVIDWFDWSKVPQRFIDGEIRTIFSSSIEGLQLRCWLTDLLEKSRKEKDPLFPYITFYNGDKESDWLFSLDLETKVLSCSSKNFSTEYIFKFISIRSFDKTLETFVEDDTKSLQKKNPDVFFQNVFESYFECNKEMIDSNELFFKLKKVVAN